MTNDSEGSKRTTVVNCKKKKYDVYIGRPSVWGNPFFIGADGDRAQVIDKYRSWIHRHPELIEKAKRELKGKVLGCWCSPEPCHGDVLIEICEENE